MTDLSTLSTPELRALGRMLTMRIDALLDLDSDVAVGEVHHLKQQCNRVLAEIKKRGRSGDV